MQKKYICVSVLLTVISFILIVTGTSSGTAFATSKFLDVNEDDWFLSDVNYVHEKSLMNGTSETTFSPNVSTTRGMIATVLWRMEGSPKGSTMSFQDVKSDAYYKEAVAWCSEKHIVIGYSNTVFAPDNFITREQLATMIYRYADYKGYDVTKHDLVSEYYDANDVSEYAIIPFEWTIKHGIITGTTANTLSPQENAKRCQVAAILKRFCTKFNAFDDVKNSQQNQTAMPDKSYQSNIGFGNKSNETSGSSSGGSSNKTSTDTERTGDDIGVSYPIISTDNITAKPGDIIQTAVNIKNNPGILGMILSAYFNEASLSLESIQNGAAFSALDLTASKTLESGMRLIWDGVEIKPEDIKDGTILLLNFKIKDDAKDGKYPITLKYADGDILDNDLKTITPAIEVGYITVVKGGEMH